MSSKLYVGNLPFSVTADQLRETFGQYGEVEEAIVVMDKMTGRPRGFGFVTFDSAEAAAKAVEALNGAPLGGRAITVSIADNRPGPGSRDRNTDSRPPRR